MPARGFVLPFFSMAAIDGINGLRPRLPRRLYAVWHDCRAEGNMLSTMNSESNWTRIEAALDEILAMPKSQWATACARIAGDDLLLHGEILALLAYTGGEDPILDRPPAAPIRTTEELHYSLSPGTRVGAYRIVAAMGRGGMGEVYRAARADGQFEQHVALKLIQRDAAGHVERFQAERQILARLEHSGIARLHDGGMADDGRPYMVMELVEGQPILDWCRERRCDLSQRLDLFTAICDAVAYAHRNLVVHRDLKPGNILVTQTGEVKLLDFGVAKLIGDPHEEQTQNAPLTPAYAAPEQLTRGAVTTATDVYALGMLLFELLSAAPPWRLTGLPIFVALEKVLREAPPAVSAVAGQQVDAPVPAHLLRGDLDAIVAKSIRKEPGQRYETVAALRADIARSLRHEPVAAREGARLYSISRFLRRYRTLVASIGTTFVILLASAGIALWQARQARMQADRAEHVKSFVLSILSEADTDSGSGAATTAVDLLKSARQRVDVELAGQPAIRTELLGTIAYGLVGQGATAEGSEAALEAVKVGTAALGDEHPLTINARVTYGEALVELGHNADAIAVLRAAVAATARADPRRRDVIETRISGERWLASALLSEGQTDKAVEVSRASLADARAVQGILPPSALAEAYSSHANILTAARADGQVAAARDAIAATLRAAAGRRTADVLAARMVLGRALVNEGRTREGLAELEAVLPETKALLGASHPDVASNTSFLATARLDGGDIRGAIEAYRETIAIEDQQSGDSEAFDKGIDRIGLAISELAARQAVEALSDLDLALSQLRAVSNDGNPYVLRARSARALALARLGRIADSEREVTQLDASQWVPRQQADHDARVAEIFGIAGRRLEAITRAQSAVSHVARGDPPITRAGADATLGVALVAAGRYADAIEPLERARSVYRERQVMMSPDHAVVLEALARVRSALGDFAAARALAVEASQFWHTFAPGVPDASRVAQLLDELDRCESSLKSSAHCLSTRL
jgi:eukaryotic-like serine/threonine-protein kinase